MHVFIEYLSKEDYHYPAPGVQAFLNVSHYYPHYQVHMNSAISQYIQNILRMMPLVGLTLAWLLPNSKLVGGEIINKEFK